MVDAPGDLLVVDGVTRHFGGVRAVEGCSLAVTEGSITGLIGPNGAGKSTLLELVSGFQRVDAGRIVLGGTEIQGLPAHKVSQLGLVRSFQSAREWRNLTVLENVLIAATAREDESLWRALVGRTQLRQSAAVGRSAARNILADFGLFDLRNERAGNLSGGQKRLLEFARIACARPRMVLLDEPQTGVNPVMGGRMADAIRQLNASGITILMVEHNLGFVERLCDRVWVMNLGSILAVGSLAELRHDARVVDAYLGSAASRAS
jgi:ABC-type branched-subunit amino acid transport system ATPase component